jgi:hypothetical protein
MKQREADAHIPYCSEIRTAVITGGLLFTVWSKLIVTVYGLHGIQNTVVKLHCWQKSNFPGKKISWNAQFVDYA